MSKVEVNQISSQCGSTLTIGQSGDTVTLACGATQTGFGRTGTVNWDTTAKTASFTAVSGNGYFVNTTSGAITVTLPAGSAGSIVSLKDYANTWQTNNVTVTPNGTDKINGINANATLSTEDQSVTLVYVDSTKGWRVVQDSTSNVTGNPFIVATGGTITTCGNCKIHTFTSPGTFCVSAVAVCSANNEVSYMVVAGGGGGGSLGTGGVCQGQGAGGAGGFREDKSPVTPYTASPLDGAGPITVTASPYPISVGGGGAGGPIPPEAPGTPGSNSIFSTITSAGGGGGSAGCAPQQVQGNGGSGGGAARYGGAPGTNPEAAGVGNTPPVSPPQGNPGGQGFFNDANLGAGGGGGGAGGAGSTNTPGCHPGNGGVGVTTSISGTPTAYAGGGASQNGGSSPCGSGASNPPSGGTGVSAPDNRGGGGASGSNGPGCFAGGSGGSGIVIIRYKYQN
jgi:hypothetical protein